MYVMQYAMSLSLYYACINIGNAASRVCVCDLMQMKQAAARGLGGYKAKSFKFEPQTVLQSGL